MSGDIAGVVRPEYGPGVYDLACRDCGATWCGEAGMACSWCVAALERQRLEQSRVLLFPPWLADQHGPRYDELGELDRRVWDTTRGQTRGDGSIRACVGRLARAVRAELITDDEARTAIRRAKGER